MAMKLQVGATVRVARPNHPKATGRALLATVQDNLACILWEDPAPLPLVSTSNRRKQFLVTPLIQTKRQRNGNGDCGEDEEYTVDQCRVQPLLSFEYATMNAAASQNDDDHDVTATDTSVDVWKDRGDQLLRLGDASAACSYYEMALCSSSNVSKHQVGSTIIVKKGGFAQIAEVDCVNDDDLDVTFVNSDNDDNDEEEATIKESEILLVVKTPDSTRIQERILLNLARCLLQLAEIDKTELERPSRYRSSAVLASTLALTLSTFHDNYQEQQQNQQQQLRHQSLGKTQQTALLLRSQAQMQRGKWSHAIADAKQILKVQPDHKEGCKLLQQIEQQKAKQKMTDKKLAKQMCQWVTKATTSNSVSEEDSPSSSVSRDDESMVRTTSNNATLPKSNSTHTSLTVWLKLLLLPIVVAWIVRQIRSKGHERSSLSRDSRESEYS